MEQALARCPWNRHWRRDLAQAYRLEGRDEDAAALAAAAPSGGTGPASAAATAPSQAPANPPPHIDYLYLSGEPECTRFDSAPSGAGC
jgi:hypothetical protein